MRQAKRTRMVCIFYLLAVLLSWFRRPGGWERCTLGAVAVKTKNLSSGKITSVTDRRVGRDVQCSRI
jgi:hypothetical protein